MVGNPIQFKEIYNFRAKVHDMSFQTSVTDLWLSSFLLMWSWITAGCWHCEKLHLSGRDLCYLMGKSPLIFFFFNLLQQLFLKLKRPFNALNHHRWQVIIQWIIFYASSNSLHTAQDIEVWPKSVVQLSVTTAFLVYYFSGEQMR